MTNVVQSYVLGHDEAELARLEHQATVLAPATTLILQQAGLQPGMRVLDLGTGAGDVAMLAAELVGPTGSVVGVDQAEAALDTARARATSRRLSNVTFERGDVNTYRATNRFDAVVGRLVFIYTPDPVAAVRHHVGNLRTGGIVVAMEFDMSAARSIPQTPMVRTAMGWVLDAFGRRGVDTTLGPKLHAVMAAAGLPDATVMGFQRYLPPDTADGAGALAGIVSTLVPVIEGTGVATSSEVDLPTLHDRIHRELVACDAVVVVPTLVGAWATIPA